MPDLRLAQSAIEPLWGQPEMAPGAPNPDDVTPIPPNTYVAALNDDSLDTWVALSDGRVSPFGNYDRVQVYLYPPNDVSVLNPTGVRVVIQATALTPQRVAWHINGAFRNGDWWTVGGNVDVLGGGQVTTYDLVLSGTDPGLTFGGPAFGFGSAYTPAPVGRELEKMRGWPDFDGRGIVTFDLRADDDPVGGRVVLYTAQVYLLGLGVTAFDPPWLRAVQRSDGLDLGGPPRAVQQATRADSLRAGTAAI